MAEKKGDFMHISGDADFHGRSDSIFGCLDKLEPTHKSDTDPEQKPSAGNRAPKNVPDHVLHPEKWTKYSLEDDGTDKITGLSGDALNKHVALSFMKEIRKRKEIPTEITESESDVVMSEKHVFSKSVIKHKVEVDEGTSKSQIVEGVNIMPEYVIGVSPSKTPKKELKPEPDNGKLQSPGKAICLDHLVENVTADTTLEASENVSDLVEEQDGAKFTKRKAKSRGGLRAHKSSTEDE